MRSLMTAALTWLAIFSALAGTGHAQGAATPPPSQGRAANSSVPAPAPRGMVMPMTPDMMQMMGAGGHGRPSAGPLQGFSKLMSALEDPQERAALGLSDEQATSLRKIIIDSETYTIKTAADVLVDSIELRELLIADKPDRAAVMSKGDAISKSGSQLVTHYLDGILAAKALLTPEQQKAIRDYVDNGGAVPAPPPPPHR